MPFKITDKARNFYKNAIRGVGITEPEDIFTPDNTKWEGGTLVYEGDMESLAEETGKSEDELYELLGEYEDESKDLIETQEDIEASRRGL